MSNPCWIDPCVTKEAKAGEMGGWLWEGRLVRFCCVLLLPSSSLFLFGGFPFSVLPIAPSNRNSLSQRNREDLSKTRKEKEKEKKKRKRIGGEMGEGEKEEREREREKEERERRARRKLERKVMEA